MFIPISQPLCWSKCWSTCKHAPKIAHRCRQFCLVAQRLDLPSSEVFFPPWRNLPLLLLYFFLLLRSTICDQSDQRRNRSRKVLHRRELRFTFANALCTQNNPGEIRGTVGPWSQAGRLANSKMRLCLWSTLAGRWAAPSFQELPPLGSFCRGQCTRVQH